MRTSLGRLASALCACTAAASLTSMGYAQIDPEPRNILQVGYSQPLHDDGPNAAYAFYYWNMPHIPTTNTTLRLAIAPVYVDGELGFPRLLGENTDFGIGLFGGGYYNSYQEVRQGNYYRDESFAGSGGGGALSIYHTFNPSADIPLNGVLRGGINYHAFSGTGDTAANFQLPNDQPFYGLHTGLRWGGKEPLLGPRLALELSAWYDLEYRQDPGPYGFSGDRRLNWMSHQFLGSALAIYTMPRTEHYLMVGLIGGAVIDADRFSAYRVGGALPFTSEYPLYLPGYFYQELSTQDFGLLYGIYSIPFGGAKNWHVLAGGATAVVNYVDGLEQPGKWNSGVLAGLGYTTKNRRLRVVTTFGYGIDAIRSDGRGGYNASIMFQYIFGRTPTFASDRAFENLDKARIPFRFTQ
jgi:hypothetical protein